jgi:hypothetical protein
MAQALPGELKRPQPLVRNNLDSFVIFDDGFKPDESAMRYLIISLCLFLFVSCESELSRCIKANTPDIQEDNYQEKYDNWISKIDGLQVSLGLTNVEAEALLLRNLNSTELGVHEYRKYVRGNWREGDIEQTNRLNACSVSKDQMKGLMVANATKICHAQGVY